MKTQQHTIFDALDNFFESSDIPSIDSISDQQILALRDAVINYYNCYSIPQKRAFETRVFLGSFLSSPPYPLKESPYITSALLHNDSVVMFDPLYYWLCDEQYRRQRFLSAPTGWRKPQNYKPDLQTTRKYLSSIFVWFYEMRSLIEAGVIILVPSESILARKSKRINQIITDVISITSPIDRYIKTFSPDEITIDDNRKGGFLYHQNMGISEFYKKNLTDGLSHFIRDIIIAEETNSLYTAPFRWEQHLCNEAFSDTTASQLHSKVIAGTAILNLPILSNVTPEVLRKLHADSKYTELRIELRRAVGLINDEINTDAFTQRIAEIENDILIPKVNEVLKEANSGYFQRITKAVIEGMFAFGQSFLCSYSASLDPGKSVQVATIASGATTIKSLMMSIAKKQDKRVWGQLLPNQQSLELYGSPHTLKYQYDLGWDMGTITPLQVKISRMLIKSLNNSGV